MSTRPLPLVSLIIRSMNRPTLTAAMTSIARQDYGSIEIVVVAASGADHPILPDVFSGRAVTFLPSDHPLGRSAAANAGLLAAGGDLLGFLDDDDMLLPQHVSALVETLQLNPQAIAAYGRVRAENAGGEVLREFGQPFDAVALQLENFLPIHSVLFRRRVREVGVRFDPALDLCEDWDFWQQVALLGDFVFHDDVTAIYRIDGASGFALQGNPEAARVAEARVTEKSLTRLPQALAYEIVVRARAFSALEAAQTRADTNEFRVQDLKRMLEELNQAHSSLCSDFEQSEFQVQDLRRMLEELNQVHSSLCSDFEQSEFQVQDLRRMQTELHQTHLQLCEEHERIGHEHRHMADRHTQLLLQHRDASRAREWLEAERQRLEAALTHTVAIYENSLSMRLTRPLRRGARLARLLRRALRGFMALDWKSRRQVLGWLMRGQSAPARRKLSLASQIAEVSSSPAHRLAAAPETWPTPPIPEPLPDSIDVLLPVYDGVEFLEPLFDSLARATSTPFRLLICDDASPDARVWPLLERQAARFPNSLLLRNADNLGFVGTVNRLFEQVEHDFVLLNSDVQVPRLWLERLLAPIQADPTVASVTPFTNAGAICSFPRFFEDCALPEGMDVDAVDAVLARLKNLPPPELSSGVGFCMAIRLSVAQKIGLFDSAFGRGYREENDWCRRAQLAGYRHVLAPNLFVHHKHGGSFPSAERQALADRNEVILRRRYPDLFDYYIDYIRRDPLWPLREFLDLQVLAAQAGRPVFVMIDNVIEGGAQAYSRELTASKLAAGIPVLKLIDDFRSGELRAQWLHAGEERVLHYENYREWGRVLAGMQVAEVFLENIYSFRQPLELLGWLAELPSTQGLAVTVAIHDYFMLCPSLFLIDAQQRYCDLPPPEACERCRTRLHTDFPTGADTIADWRAVWGTLLRRSQRILAFSSASAALVTRVYPDCAEKIDVQPHSLALFQPRPLTPPLDTPLHIGVVGSISWHKGWEVVKGLCDAIERRGLPYRVTVIGSLIPEFSSPCLTITGPYGRGELADRMRMSGANLFFFASIWPETFSYVAHEIMACGVPFCCFDLGAPATSAKAYPQGCVLPLDASPTELLDRMDAFRRSLATAASPDFNQTDGAAMTENDTSPSAR